MTCVWSRDHDGPATHAFLIGVGRYEDRTFENLVAAPTAVAGMAAYLLDHRDRLGAPLASIECLLSDPAVAAGADRLIVPPAPDRPAIDAAVNPVTRAGDHIETAFDAWKARIRPGDSLFFYACAHGLSGREERGLIVAEDYHTGRGGLNRNALIDISDIHDNGCAMTRASACWVFADACQDFAPDLVNQIKGAGAYSAFMATTTDIARAGAASAVFLRAAQPGMHAWAPDDGAAPFFTQALLFGLRHACIEYRQGSPVIAATMLSPYALGQISLAKWGRTLVATGGSRASGMDDYLSTIDSAQIRLPVSVSTNPLLRLGQLQSGVARCVYTQAQHALPPGGAAVWRFEMQGLMNALRFELEPQAADPARLYPLSHPAARIEVSYV